jgi:hypothetical protein
MKITKSRLLQIIREEVELHEKKLEESTFELDEKELVDLSQPLPTEEQPVDTEQKPVDSEADKDGDGKISGSEAKKVLDQAKMEDEAAGRLMVKVHKKVEKEDKLFEPKKDPKTGTHKVVASFNKKHK